MASKHLSKPELSFVPASIFIIHPCFSKYKGWIKHNIESCAHSENIFVRPETRDGKTKPGESSPITFYHDISPDTIDGIINETDYCCD